MRFESISTSVDCICVPENCRLGCSLEIIDSLLRTNGTVRGEEVDMLLDLRWFLYHRENSESAVALFCRLRLAMEERHYLAFYRLRRWLENHVQVSVRTQSDNHEQIVPLKLDRYCIEAVRHQCLQPALISRKFQSAPRAQFVFRSLALPSREIVALTTTV